MKYNLIQDKLRNGEIVSDLGFHVDTAKVLVEIYLSLYTKPNSMNLTEGEKLSICAWAIGFIKKVSYVRGSNKRKRETCQEALLP